MTKGLNVRGFAAVGVGGILGCWLRYILSVMFNSISPHLPPGTLAANWIAAFCIGCLVGAFQQFETIPIELRLFSTTGIMGGLSTYSTFSAEAVSLLLARHYGWFAVHILSHLMGSLALTLLGIYLVHLFLGKRYQDMDNPEPEK